MVASDSAAEHHEAGDDGRRRRRCAATVGCSRSSDGREDEPEQRRASRLDGGAVAERHQDESGISDHRLRRAGQHAHHAGRGPSRCRRGRAGPRAGRAASATGPTRRSGGRRDRPARSRSAMPCLAATKPAAQPNAAPMPHKAPIRMPEERAGRVQDHATSCAGDLRPPDTLGLPAKSNRQIKTLTSPGWKAHGEVA